MVMIIGILGSLKGFLYFTGIDVSIPSKICLHFSACSEEIKGSSHTPNIDSHRDSKANWLELTISPQGTASLNPLMNIDFPVLDGPHKTRVLRLDSVLVIHL